MILFEFKRIESLYLNLLNVYEHSKKYKSSKEYNITSFSLNRSFHLRTAKKAPELENQADRFSIGQIWASPYKIKLETRLQTPKKIALQCMEDLVW